MAAAIGVLLSLGASLQQAGLATTSATNGGFLTACYVVLTPFVVWALSGARPRAIVLVAGAVSLAGAWVLATGGGPARPPTIGDGLVLLAVLAWATQIALTPIYLGRTGRPLRLAFSQYAVCSALAAATSIGFETAEPTAFLAAAPAILFAGLVSGGLGYTLQIVAQRYTPSAEAALILSLESVFAAVAGAIWLGERLTLPASRAGLIDRRNLGGRRRRRSPAGRPRAPERDVPLRKAEPLRRPSALQGTESGLICCYRVGAERISASLLTFQLAIFLRSLMLLGRGGLVGRRQGLTGRLGGSLKGGAARSLLKANLRTSAMFCAPWPLRTRDRSSWKVTSSVQCSVFSMLHRLIAPLWIAPNAPSGLDSGRPSGRISA